MPMMMSVLDPGFLGSMLNMSMKQSFAAHLGHQVSLSLSLSLYVCVHVHMAMFAIKSMLIE